MDDKTRFALNAINRAFYAERAAAFSATREHAWPGWDRALAALPGREDGGGPLRVLDIGCGNGRLAGPLAGRFAALEYIGLDASDALLAAARERYGGRGIRFLRAELVESDLEGALPPGPFDFIAVFGLLHHVPGQHQRRGLLEALCARLAPGGLLAAALWRFGAFERFRRRLAPWAEQPEIDCSQLEPGDFLLRWGDAHEGVAGHVRYCHYASDDEGEQVMANLPANVVDCFDADGRTGDLNRYWLLRRPV